MRSTYHHGDLKQALIEKGLEYIGEHGTESLSLRKLAALCDVSSAAPYAHFKDKDELLKAIHEYIMESFTAVIKECAERNEDDLLCELGCEYVMFFSMHPLYYSFLFSPERAKMDISPERGECGNVPPFDIFKETVFRMADSAGLPESDTKDILLAMWALVHGLAAFASQNINMEMDRERVRSIIRTVRVM